MHVIDGTKLSVKSRAKMTAGVKPLLKILQPILDDRFALVHTLVMPGRREKIDALLAGPHGILVLKVESFSGRYRFLGDHMYAWNAKIQDFVVSEYNPVVALKQEQRLVEAALTSGGMATIVPVDSAIIFMDSKLQLEHMQPPVRLIDRGAIKDWATKLASAHVYVEQRDIEKTLTIFGAHASIGSTPREPVSFEEPESPRLASTRPKRARRGPLGLTYAQFIAIIAMIVIYLVVLAFAVYFLFL